MPYIDVTALQMLLEVAGDLDRDGVRLVLARDIGEVRDVVSAVVSDSGLDRVYPSVQAAVEAVGGKGAAVRQGAAGRRPRPAAP